jgi:hypothetical protein
MGELLDKFCEHYDAVFRVEVCSIFSLPSSRILSTSHPPLPTACASCHLLVQAMRGVFASAGVDMWMMHGPLFLMTIRLDAAEMLRSTPLTLV